MNCIWGFSHDRFNSKRDSKQFSGPRDQTSPVRNQLSISGEEPLLHHYRGGYSRKVRENSCAETYHEAQIHSNTSQQADDIAITTAPRIADPPPPPLVASPTSGKRQGGVISLLSLPSFIPSKSLSCKSCPGSPDSKNRVRKVQSFNDKWSMIKVIPPSPRKSVCSGKYLLPQELVKGLIQGIPKDIFFTPLRISKGIRENGVAHHHRDTICRSQPPLCSHVLQIHGPDGQETEQCIVKNRETQHNDEGVRYHDERSLRKGEADDEEEVLVCGHSISTYPRILEDGSGIREKGDSLENGRRQGDPICDHFEVGVYSNGLIFCVCDGCGWGLAPAQAAKTVCRTFISSLQGHSLVVDPHSVIREEAGSSYENPPTRERSVSDGDSLFKKGAMKVVEMVTALNVSIAAAHRMEKKHSVQNLARTLLEVVAEAHNNIFVGKRIWDCGTTTVCAGLLVDLVDDKDHKQELSSSSNVKKKGLIMVSLGDCKAYSFSRRLGKIVVMRSFPNSGSSF